MKKSIIFIILATLLLVSCAQKEAVTKNTINNEEQNIKKENSGEYMMDNSKINNDSTMMNETRVIKIDAKRWEYSQKEIRVKKGEKVIIRINNTDVLHGIAIPGMKLVGNDEVTLDTSKTGTFEFRCANYCGSGHSTMKGKIIIE